MSRRPAARAGIVFGALLLLTTAAPLLLLAGVDHGVFNRQIAALLGAKMGRKVTFSRLHAHLLDSRPTISADGVVIGSPPAITKLDLLTTPHLTAHIRLLPLLAGRFEADDLIIERPVLRLVRLSRGHNNFTLGSGGPTSGFVNIGRLTARDGRVSYWNLERQLTLMAAFSHDARANPARPLELEGGGTIAGQPFTVTAGGGRLNARVPNAPYSFDALIRDGATKVSLAGVSGKPFEFERLDLNLRASGPNLADFAYLFRALAPNSAPFDFTARLHRDAPRLDLTRLVGHVGRSDLTGEISTDRPPGAQRWIKGSVRSQALYIQDVRAMISPRPPHAAARSRSGAVPAESLSRDKPFNVAGLRKADLHLAISAARVPDSPVTVRDLSTVLTLSGGRLALNPLGFSTAPGQVKANLVLDGSRNVPSLTLKGVLAGARLAQLQSALAPTVDGELTSAVDLKGSGASLRAALRDLTGRLSLRISHGRLQRTKALALSGRYGQALLSKLGEKGQAVDLTCAAVDFTANAGRLQTDRLYVATAVGGATGRGFVDLTNGSLAFVLHSIQSHNGLMHIDIPISVRGKLNHPTIKLGTDKALSDLIGPTPPRSPTQVIRPCA